MLCCTFRLHGVIGPAKRSQPIREICATFSSSSWGHAKQLQKFITASSNKCDSLVSMTHTVFCAHLLAFNDLDRFVCMIPETVLISQYFGAIHLLTIAFFLTKGPSTFLYPDTVCRLPGMIRQLHPC